MNRVSGVSSAIAAALLVVGLIIGGLVGIFAAPLVTPPQTQTITQFQTIISTTTRVTTVTAGGAPPPTTPLPSLVEQNAVKLGTGLPYIPASLVNKKSSLSGEIRVGALLSLSGDLRTFGENHKAALELARDDINAWLSRTNPD
jgi:hypothetical protein